MSGKIITIERFLLDHQPDYAKGDFTGLLYDLALAGKMIAAQTRRAGLLNVLGVTEEVNIQGEQQQKLDILADDVIVRMNDHTGRLRAMVSEERENWIEIPDHHPKGSYVLVYDPLDGSSNIDSNISIGTIFGIYRAMDGTSLGNLEDCLQPGRNLVGAGYILYGTSTMLVYSAGKGVHGFTLDPELGEFLLSHENMRFPSVPAYYSVNYASFNNWPNSIQNYVRWLHDDCEPKLSQRYIGSLVSDFHRNLIHGGVYAYPGEIDKPKGKIRLLYEASPLAFLAEQAGGYGSDGHQPILDITPRELHQRTPLFIGNRSLVEVAEKQILKNLGR